VDLREAECSGMRGRQFVIERYASTRMVRHYLTLYERTVATENAM